MLTVQPAIIWLIALVVFLVVEIVTMGLTSIWFAGGSLVAVVLALVGTPFWLQVIVFLIVSAVLLAFTRPIAVKYFNKDRVRTNVESLVGREVIVVSEVDNLHGVGRVTVSGQEWSARNIDQTRVLPVGTVGIVRGIDGVKLIIEERKEEN